MFSLKDQVALVTGGANGIGRGIVNVLAEAGAFVVIGDIDEKAGEKAAKEVKGAFYNLDVTDEARVNEVVAAIEEEHGKIDVLVSNTGIFPNCMIADMTAANWDQMMDVNVKGMFFVTKAVLKGMKARGYGRVVLTSSITGPVTGFPGWAHYGASKAAQLGFMRNAALEYARDGITINAVQPGNILTDGLAAQGEAYLEGAKDNIPTHTLGKPEDIGTAALFFASKEASFITGQAIVVDGGQILPESPEALEI